MTIDTDKFDLNLSVDTGNDADTLYFAACVLDRDATLLTGTGNDIVYIGKRKASPNSSSLVVVGNKAKKVTLKTGSQADTVQVASNTFDQFFADLGSENDSLETSKNKFLLRYELDGGLGTDRLRQSGDSTPKNGKLIKSF